MRVIWPLPRDALRVELEGESTGVPPQYAGDPTEGRSWRADGSYLGFALGNWALATTITARLLAAAAAQTGGSPWSGVPPGEAGKVLPWELGPGANLHPVTCVTRNAPPDLV